MIWDGHGSALKPSYEPIIVAMKPLDGTFAQNAERHGVAGLWIDGGRIATTEIRTGSGKRTGNMGWGTGNPNGNRYTDGRWPPNCILDEHAAGLLDEQSGVTKSTGGDGSGFKASSFGMHRDNPIKPRKSGLGLGDSGGASRFFYVAKPSRAERDAGCYALEPRQRDDSRNADQPSMNGGKGNAYNRGAKPVRNNHPTVKPLSLMRYLVRLTRTPAGGTVLDPFAGSGTTGMACVCEDRDFVGIDLNPDYVEIAKARISHVQKHGPKWDVDERQTTITQQTSLLDEDL
jgi:site-specific DNA-methyltransferase (adenine-specific)